VLLTKIIPKLPDNLRGQILVFDSTLKGYKTCLKWMNDNQVDTSMRLVIPYSTSHRDYIDYEEAKSDEELLQYANKFSPEYKFDIQEGWGKEDCTKNITLWESELFDRRDPKTGQTTIQTYLLGLRGTEDEEMIITMCAHKYDVNPTRVRYEYEKLPRVIAPDLPFHILYGPFPIDKARVIEAITKYINLNEIPNLSFRPSTDGNHVFEKRGGKWYSVFCRGLPYGVSISEFSLLNNHTSCSTWFDPLKFDRPTELMCVPVEWDPVFRRGEYFETIEDYLYYWIKITLDKEVRAIIDYKKEIEWHAAKRKFIQSIIFSVRSEDSSKRCYLDESKEEKVKRVRREFRNLDNPDELLLLPIIDLEGKLMFSELPPPEECARDSLLKKINFD